MRHPVFPSSRNIACDRTTRNKHGSFLCGKEFDGPYPGCGLVQKGRSNLLHPSETVLVVFSQAVDIGLRFQVQKSTIFTTIFGEFLVHAHHHAASAARLHFPAAKSNDPTTDSKIRQLTSRPLSTASPPLRLARQIGAGSNRHHRCASEGGPLKRSVVWISTTKFKMQGERHALP